MGTRALDGRTLDVRADRPDMRDRIYNPRLRSLPTTFPPPNGSSSICHDTRR